MRTQKRLLTGTGLLAFVQFAHLLDVLRYSDTATFPSVLADPVAMTGISTAAAAFLAVATRQTFGTTTALIAGAAISLGFTLYHGLPINLGLNNPYWGLAGSNADLIQWATVIAAIAVGAWTARVAWRAPSRSEIRPRTLTEVANT